MIGNGHPRKIPRTTTRSKTLPFLVTNFIKFMDEMPPRDSPGPDLWNVDEVGSHEANFVSIAGKTVKFYETVSYREIAPLTEISDEEIAIVWYSDDDYAKIKEEVTATLKKAAGGEEIVLEEGFCMRGLEGRTKFGGRKKKNYKTAALKAVWTTQIRQWRNKQTDAMEIAEAYQPHSLKAKFPAIETGHKDEIFVKEGTENSEAR